MVNREKIIVYLKKDTENRYVCMDIGWMGTCRYICIDMNMGIEITVYIRSTKWCKRELSHLLKAISCIKILWCTECLMLEMDENWSNAHKSWNVRYN